MGTIRGFIRGAALGAGAMYYLDPQRGARRRAGVRDRAEHARHELRDTVEKARRDASNRVRGLVAEARGRVFDREADDDVLEARVRSALGRAVSHPRAIHVRAHQGRVVLSGEVLADEVETLLETVGAVRGVHELADHLEVYAEPGQVPSLQGGRTRTGALPELLQENWSPATRVLVGGMGAGLALKGLFGRGPIDRLAGVAGIGLLARAALNVDARRLTGLGAVDNAADIRKSIHIDAPVSEVFEIWRNFENFPRFMSHLNEVRQSGDNRSHWVAKLPGGLAVEWEAETTAIEPNELIAWRSVEGSEIEHHGSVRFIEDRGGTRIDIRMVYSPPAGAIGHALASLIGVDAKRLMDDDLVRLQSLIEEGRTSASGRHVTREEVTTT